MASRPRKYRRNLFGFEFRRLFATASPRSLLPARIAPRAPFAGAGLAALLALPLLLLLSVAFAVPMAVPAVIGVGYLALSQALVGEHYRRADFITACVFGSLVGWVLLYALTGEGQFSPVEMTAALVAPIIAAAPAAFARSSRGATETPERTPDVLRQAALDRVACLNELTPCEQVLMLDLGGVGARSDRCRPAELSTAAGSVRAPSEQSVRRLMICTEVVDAIGRIVADFEQRPPRSHARRQRSGGRSQKAKLLRARSRRRS